MLGKSELAQQVAQKTGMPNARANQFLNAVLETITESLSRGDEVRLTGFGSFKVMDTKARVRMHPRTREQIHVPAGKRLSFSPGTQLSGAVRGETRKAA